MEGGSGRVAAASGAVLQQEAKARGGLWALHQSGKKTMARFPFKGGPRDAAEGGRGSRVMCGGWNGGERGGLGTAGNGSGDRHQPPAGRHGRRHCRATVAGDGTWVTRARAADRRGLVTAGPGGQRRGAGERGSAAAALTCGTQPAAGEVGRSRARVGRPRENTKWAGPG
jgi:hypothetical protein